MEQPESTAPRPSWWSRNWKWAVPVGCVTPVLVCGGFITAIVMIVFGVIKSSDAYTESLARAQNSKQVQAVLGEPIEAGVFVTGNVSISGDSGHADLTIPITGPKGPAILYVVAKKVAGKWQYSRMEVAPENGEPIDLLKEPPP